MSEGAIISDLFLIFIILWYFLNGIKSNLEKIADSLRRQEGLK